MKSYSLLIQVTLSYSELQQNIAITPKLLQITPSDYKICQITSTYFKLQAPKHSKLL